MGAVRPEGKPRDRWRDGPAEKPLRRAVGAAGRQTTRKPLLLLRFDGLLLLLRFAERQFCALLFQLPPRFTRLEPVSRHQRSRKPKAESQKPKAKGLRHKVERGYFMVRPMVSLC